MVEVGSMKITVGLITSSAEQGLARLGQAVKRTASDIKGMFSDFGRLGEAVKTASGWMIKLGAAGLAVMTAMATKSPILAGTFARMGVEMFKLGNTFATILKPVMDEFANNLLPSINNFVQKNIDLFSTMAGVGATAISDLSSVISGEFSAIDNLIPKSMGALAGAALGAKFGFKGMLIGAFLGQAIADKISTNVSDSAVDPYGKSYGDYGAYKNTMKATDEFVSFTKEQWENPWDTDSKDLWKWFGLAFKSGFQATADTVQWLINKNQKDADAYIDGLMSGSGTW